MRTRTITFLGTVAVTVGILATQTLRSAAATPDQLAAAHLDGYRVGLEHAALGLLSPPDGGTNHSERTAEQ